MKYRSDLPASRAGKSTLYKKVQLCTATFLFHYMFTYPIDLFGKLFGYFSYYCKEYTNTVEIGKGVRVLVLKIKSIVMALGKAQKEVVGMQS